MLWDKYIRGGDSRMSEQDKNLIAHCHIKNLRKLKKQGVDKFLEGKSYW